MELSTEPTIYVNGEWLQTDATFDVTDPATHERLGTAGEATTAQAAAAIDAAYAAAGSWRQVPVEERGELLRRTADGIRANLDTLAILLSRENGKPKPEAVGELAGAAKTLDWCAEEGRRVYGRIVPLDASRQGFVRREPVGVTLAISPWNFPASMLIRKIGLALAAGCTVVAKPAEQTPLIATAVLRLFIAAGFPAGVLNQITTTAPGPVVQAMLADERVAKLSFTGSTEVGRALQADTQGTLKSVSLELGGHAPGIVFADADIPATVEAVVGSKFKNAGQSCTALNRLFVDRRISAEFTEALVRRVKALTVGNGLDDNVDVGPLIDEGAVTKLEAQLADATDNGASVVVGGSRAAVGDGDAAGSLFFEPTVVTGADASMLLAREEIFGPVLPVYEFDDQETALELANDTSYGLAAYLYGTDAAALWRTAERLGFGVIGINDPFPVAPEMPFGGMKNSGIGREAGAEGIEAYLKVKAITVRF